MGEFSENLFAKLVLPNRRPTEPILGVRADCVDPPAHRPHLVGRQNGFSRIVSAHKSAYDAKHIRVLGKFNGWMVSK